MLMRFTAPILALALMLPFTIWAASGSPVAAAKILPPALDLPSDAKDVSASRRPLLVLFSETGCLWCERARREVLLPMQSNPGYQSRVLFRQIDIDKETPLTGFDGKPTSHRAFARALKVSRFPTIMLLGPNGEALAEPLIGFGIADFYGAYLDRRIDDARAKLAPGNATGAHTERPSHAR